MIEYRQDVDNFCLTFSQPENDFWLEIFLTSLISDVMNQKANPTWERPNYGSKYKHKISPELHICLLYTGVMIHQTLCPLFVFHNVVTLRDQT